MKKLLTIGSIGLVLASCGGITPENATANAASQSISSGSKKSVTGEAFGPLVLGQKPSQVVNLLGEPQSKGKKTMQEATGTSIQEWNYPAKGLTVFIESSGADDALSMIQATGNCKFATARGIKIGSSEEAVKKAYAKERSQDGSSDGNSFLAGSPYDGVVFTFKSGKVSEIFVGAAAE